MGFGVADVLSGVVLRIEPARLTGRQPGSMC
jgi:hypothetical protein